MKKIKIIVAIIVIGGLVWFFMKGSVGQQVSKLDPTDTVSGFYDQWLKALKDPGTADPSKATLSKSPILSKELKTKIASVQADANATVDPVLCQATIPEAISQRSVYVRENEAQMLVTSKDKKVTNQAIVMLKKLNEGWYINDIQCTLGEFAPEKEFSFENEGYLLKTSIPKPYDSKNWHLVFEENGQGGHVAPLFFDKDSQCTDLNGSKSVCAPDKFIETSKVSVHAQMSEKGATVKKLEFIK